MRKFYFRSQLLFGVITKALLANRRFGDAKNLALKLKVDIEKENRNQRQSALPAVIRLLIESSAGVSLVEGIEEFGRNSKSLPKKLSEKLKKELLEASAFSNQKLSEIQRRKLGA